MEILTGVVIDNNDPLKIGRVKLKIFGETEKSNDVPWSEVMQSASIGLVGGIGLSSVLKVGAWVYVVKLEDEETRYLVIGVCVGIQGQSEDITYGIKGISDFAQLCTNGATLQNKAQTDNTATSKGYLFKYTNTVNPGSYLNSTVLRTEKGIMIELNDSSEMIKITHPSGSTIVMNSDGSVSLTTLNDLNFTVKGDMNVNVKGNYNVNVDGNIRSKIAGDEVTSIDGNINTTVYGSATYKVNKDLKQITPSKLSIYANNGTDLTTSNVDWNVDSKINMKTDTIKINSEHGMITYADIITERGIDLDNHVHGGVDTGVGFTKIPE